MGRFASSSGNDAGHPEENASRKIATFGITAQRSYVHDEALAPGRHLTSSALVEFLGEGDMPRVEPGAVSREPASDHPVLPRRHEQLAIAGSADVQIDAREAAAHRSIDEFPQRDTRSARSPK
jgi:hypothetical protein